MAPEFPPPIILNILPRKCDSYNCFCKRKEVKRERGRKSEEEKREEGERKEGEGRR